jgi:hypothetical protein
MSELETKIYRCEFCKFFTKYKCSLQEHNKLNKCKEKKKLECIYCKKEFQYPRDLEIHKNKLKKCYISNKNDLLEIVENSEKEIKINIEKQLESTINENNFLKDRINDLEQRIESNKNERINWNRSVFRNYSLSLVDRDKIIKDNKLKKSDYIYKLEYHILRNTIFEVNNIDSEDNIDSENKEIFFLLLDIVNKDRLEEIIKKVKNENRKDLIELMIEYGGKLKNRLNFESKLYGKNIKEYEIIYNKLIENIS